MCEPFSSEISPITQLRRGFVGFSLVLYFVMSCFAPTNELLVRQGVSKRSNPFSRQSIAEGICLLLCLRGVLLKDVLLWTIRQFVLRRAETVSVLFINDRAEYFQLHLDGRMTCLAFARHIKEQSLDPSLAIDTFWIHISKTNWKPKLLFMGSRANACISDGTRKAFGLFESWTAPPLSEEELNWLNSRTLLEAGVEDGDFIDARYTWQIEILMEGETIGVDEMKYR